MKFSIFDLIFPDYCCSCGEIGGILCESCYYHIVSDNSLADCCLGCLKPCGLRGVCSDCRRPFSRAWAGGSRGGALKKLVDVSKYGPRRSGCRQQARILDEALPFLPKDVIIVPIPTIRKHVRQRAFGHSELIARYLADLRGLRYQLALGRVGNLVQQGASSSVRRDQAKRSYVSISDVKDATILLVDDVYTTGATIDAAAKVLLKAGASGVWVAVTARQLPR